MVVVPRTHWLVLLTALIIAPPVLARILGSGVASFGMFTHFVRYHLDISMRASDGVNQRVPVARLVPHLSRDARRVIAPAERWFIDETHVELLGRGLEDIGRVVCELMPDAKSVRVRLIRRELNGVTLSDLTTELTCHPK